MPPRLHAAPMEGVFEHFEACGIVLPNTWRELPINRCPAFGGALKVSWTDSLFHAPGWYARTPNPGVGATEGVRFDTLPAAYRWTGRIYLWALDHVDTVGVTRRAKSAGSARLSLSYVRRLTTELDAIGIRTLKDVPPAVLLYIFRSYCDLESAKPKTRSRAERFAQVLQSLYQLGPTRDCWLPDGLAFDPDPLVSGIVRQGGLRPIVGHGAIEDDDGHELGNLAIRYVEDLASPIFMIIGVWRVVRAVRKTRTPFYARKAIDELFQRRPDLLEKLKTARTAFDAPLWHIVRSRADRQYAHIDADDLMRDCLNLGLIARELREGLQAMCYVVCAIFNGWRVSEILSTDDRAVKAFAAGFTLETRLRKGTLDPTAEVARPVPPIVAKAMKVLAELNLAYFGDHAGRQFRSDSGGQATCQAINRGINEVHRFHKGVEAPRITTHQFRGFFAEFYLRRFKGNLDALRRHFRHVSRDALWAYVRDAGGARYLAKAKRALAIEISKSIVFGDEYKSRGVGARHRSRLQYLARTMSLEDAEREIKRNIEEDMAEVHPMPWGYCLFQKGQVGAVCEAKDGPIEARSEPGTCGRCQFLATGPENIVFWQGTYLVHQEVVESPLSVPILKQTSAQMVEVATEILLRHGIAGSPGEATDV